MSLFLVVIDVKEVYVQNVVDLIIVNSQDIDWNIRHMFQRNHMKIKMKKKKKRKVKRKLNMKCVFIVKKIFLSMIRILLIIVKNVMEMYVIIALRPILKIIQIIK